MKIQPTIPLARTQNKNVQPVDRQPKNHDGSKGVMQKDSYIPGKYDCEVLTYGQSIKNNPSICIELLREQSEETFQSLKQIVVQLLKRQGYCTESLKTEELDNVVVDEIARTEAAELIAEDGPLGAESVSDRIVQFAMAISGGDKTKISLLKDAIDRGFNQVKNMLGQLPEVSLKTYDLIMEKLSQWEQEISE